MTTVPAVRRLLALLVLLLACGGCGNDAGRRSVTVFAAASLTEPFTELKTALEASKTNITPTFSFAGSGALVAQIEQGAPADVIATADMASMQRLVDAGLVETPATFARNKLEILVQPGNPKGITTIADLSRTDIVFVTGDESVPAGKYTAQMFQAAGITVSPKSKEVDVKAAVARVTSGEADATVVYVTDVRAAGSKAQGVPIPDAQNVTATYMIAVVQAAQNEAAARVFVDAVVRDLGQDTLRAHGFLRAS